MGGGVKPERKRAGGRGFNLSLNPSNELISAGLTQTRVVCFLPGKPDLGTRTQSPESVTSAWLICLSTVSWPYGCCVSVYLTSEVNNTQFYVKGQNMEEN